MPLIGILLPMIGLLIDTSIDKTLLALSDGTVVKIDLKASESLLPEIQKLIPLKKLSYIAVGNGPGAFTGTRLGVMTAKTLTYATGIPLISFCSLKRLVPTDDGPFTALVSAKSRGHYALAGYREGSSISFGAPYLLTSDEPMPDHTLVYDPSSIDHLIALTNDKFTGGESVSPSTLEVTYLHTP